MDTLNTTNLNEEVSIKLTGKITLLIPELEVNLTKQLELKTAIDEILYDYKIYTKSTELIASDILEKA